MKRNFIPMVMLLVIAAIFALRYLTACKRPDYRAESRGTLPANAYYKEGSKRFVIERIEVVTDDMAYNDRRGVYLIRDTETGHTPPPPFDKKRTSWGLRLEAVIAEAAAEEAG